MRPVGIVGCPCSATHYMRAVLNTCGLEVGSEQGPLKDGQCAWTLIVQPQLETMKWIIHQVRHPVRVISSLDALPEIFWEEVAPYVQLPADSLQRRIEFWMQWNLLCEARAHWTYAIREVKVVFPKIAWRLGIQSELPDLPTNFNTKSHLYRRLGIDLILSHLGEGRREEFIRQTSRYGYSMQDLREAWPCES